MKGETVYTCLSHDMVSHELTHALLDGLRAQFTLPTRIDYSRFTKRSQMSWPCCSTSVIRKVVLPRSGSRAAASRTAC